MKIPFLSLHDVTNSVVSCLEDATMSLLFRGNDKTIKNEHTIFIIKRRYC